MKIKNKKVYYCDYCKKHSLRNITLHEKHCTLNPHRDCRMCGRKDINLIIPKYKIEVEKEWLIDQNTISGEKQKEVDDFVNKKIEELKEEVEEEID